MRTGSPLRETPNASSLSLPAREPAAAELDLVAARDAVGRGGGGQRLPVDRAVDGEVGAERGLLAVALEVGEGAVAAGLGQGDRGAPATAAIHARVQVLEALGVAADDDQVHALVLLHLEVAHGAALAVEDPEAQRCPLATGQLRAVEGEREAVRADREAGNRLRARGSGAVTALLGHAVHRHSRR